MIGNELIDSNLMFLRVSSTKIIIFFEPLKNF
jgi:hypothetical protein